MSIIHILVGLLPVLIFLAALIYLDSYKLIRFRSVLIAIGAGCCSALVALVVNTAIMQNQGISWGAYSNYVAPVIEELLKASFLIYLFRAKKVGFMVDAALYGMAIGAGFACTENIVYLTDITEANILFWLVRGFGTAMMHGGATAFVGIIARSLSDVYPTGAVRAFGLGLLLAIVFHSVFNHFIVDPVTSTALILVVLPSLMMFIFRRSEEATRKWLGVGLDSDLELLNLIETGNLPDSNIGRYLTTLKERFPAMVIGDMLSYLGLYTELSMRAKGILMMHEGGFHVPKDPEIKSKFLELHYLEKSIGTTGRMAILPVLRVSSRSLWQLELLQE